MGSKSKDARTNQMGYWEDKLDQRLAILAEKEMGPKQIKKDNVIKMIRGNIRKTDARLASIAKMESKLVEMAKVKEEKLAMPKKDKKSKETEKEVKTSKRQQKKKMKAKG